MANQSQFKHIEDAELIRAAPTGGTESRDELIRRYRGATFLIAQQIIGSREAAEDASQEALILAMQQLGQLKDPEKFAPWLYAVTRRISYRTLSKERRTRSEEDGKLELLLSIHQPEKASCPYRTALAAESGREIGAALNDLPLSIRLVMKLYYYEQWDVAQICEFLSLTRTTVKWRLHSGRQKMAKQLNDILKEEEKRCGQE